MSEKSQVDQTVAFDRRAAAASALFSPAVAANDHPAARRRVSCADAAGVDDPKQFSNCPPRPAHRLGFGRVGQGFSTPGIIKAMTNTFTLAITRQAIALLVGAFFAWLVARTDLPMKGCGIFLLAVFLSASFAGDHGMDPFARPKIWPAQSRADRARCGKPAVVQHLFILGHCLGSYGWHRERQSYAARAGLSQSRRGPRRVLAYLRREWLAYFFSYHHSGDDAGDTRDHDSRHHPILEAFEIELLLGTPIGLQVYSTKIHELVTWEPPQFAPAMALSTVFLGLLLLMVAFQRRYIAKEFTPR